MTLNKKYFSLDTKKDTKTSRIRLWPRSRRDVLNILLDQFPEILAVEVKELFISSVQKKNITLFPLASYYVSENPNLHYKSKVNGSGVMELLGLHVKEKVSSIRLREMELSILRCLGDRVESMHCIFICHTMDGSMKLVSAVQELHALWKRENLNRVCLVNRYVN